MKRFLHNRIGTYVRESEVSKLRSDVIALPLTKGQIVAYEEIIGTKQWVMYISDKDKDNANVYGKKDPSDESEPLNEMAVPITSLRHYSKGEPLEFLYKVDQKITADGLLETYRISKK